MGNEVIQVNNLMSVKERFSLEGKKAFVTGAAGGIGSATATALAELGADVAIVDIAEKGDKAREIAETISHKFSVNSIPVAVDVTDPVSVDKMITTILKEYGTIDVVHSNAGILFKDDGPDIPFEQWQKMVAVNLTGMYLVDKAAAHVMKDSGKGGSVINTVSISAHIINRTMYGANVAYCASKGGALQLTKAMAAHYAEDKIRFNSISPGMFVSGFHDGLIKDANMNNDQFYSMANDNTPMKRAGNLNEIGGAVAFLATDISSYITGADLVVDGGYIVW